MFWGWLTKWKALQVFLKYKLQHDLREIFQGFLLKYQRNTTLVAIDKWPTFQRINYAVKLVNRWSVVGRLEFDYTFTWRITTQKSAIQ